MEHKLIITSPKQCIEVITALLDNTYTEDKRKYASYISMAYFVKNLHLFPKYEIDKVLANEQLSTSISAKLSYELLENAIKNNAIFTSYSKKWFNNIKGNQQLLLQYLPILLGSNDNKQIEDFCNANPVLSKAYYNNNHVQNYTFEKYVIGNNPSLITRSRLLSEEDIIELFEKKIIKYEHIKTVISQYSIEFQTLVTKEEVKHILSYDIDNSKQWKREEIMNLVAVNAVFFITKLKELQPEFTKKLLASPGKVYLGVEPKITINFLQSIVLEESCNKINAYQLVELALNDYKDILFQDVKNTIGKMKYNYTKDYLIKTYEDEEYEVFKSLAKFQEQLEPFQKDIVLTACFDSLFSSYKHANDNDIKFTMANHITPLLFFPYEPLFEKLTSLKDISELDESILLQVEKYILNNKLTEKLTEKNSKDKKLKI